MRTSSHLTTRRGFVAAMGFGGISLYGLWVGYGAAPGPAALFGAADIAEDHPQDSAGGHGAVATGPDAEAFRREVADFVRRFAQPDGSVYPSRDERVPMEMPDSGMGADTDASAMDHGEHGRHGAESPATTSEEHAAPIGIPLLAERWFYEPAHLRLDAGTAYRFRLMATDVPHGASVQFGGGARMIRLRPGSVTEIDLTFTRPGRYLVYCTTYCGTAHDAMQARVDVV